MRLDELLQRKMHDYGMSKRALSQAVGCSRTYITHITCQGLVGIPPEIRCKLCRVLDIAPHVLDAAIRESEKAR